MYIAIMSKVISMLLITPSRLSYVVSYRFPALKMTSSYTTRLGPVVMAIAVVTALKPTDSVIQ